MSKSYNDLRGANSLNSKVKVFSKDGLINIANAQNSQISFYDITGILKIKTIVKSSLESFDGKVISNIRVVSEVGTSVYKVINY